MKNPFILILKSILTCALFFILWKQISQKVSIEELLDLYVDGWESNKIWFLIACIFLIPINWGLEVFKWKKVIGKVQQIDWKTSIKAILLGVTFSIYTPNRIGEYGGRVFILKKKRWESFFATLMGSLSQITANVLWSGLGFILFISLIEPIYNKGITTLLCIAVVVVISLVFILYYKIYWIDKIPLKIRFFQKIKEGISILSLFNKNDKKNLFWISSSRFFVYGLQHVLLIYFFSIHISWTEAALATMSIFFMQTIIPSIALVELGIRGNISLFVLGFITNNSSGILDVSITIWLINIILPAIAGSWVLWRVKWINAKND